MPPRSYYNSPRVDDYVAFSRALFPSEIEAATAFSISTGRPYIVTENHLASYLGISGSIIRQILERKVFHYRMFPLKKTDGTRRIIKTPKTYLKVIQWWINDNVLSTGDLRENVHGFRKGRSYISNAIAHNGAKHILNVDIRKFFPSITFEMILGVFRDLGYNAEGATLLAELTSLDGMAPTGAPTSPQIGNLVLFEFDGKTAELAAANNIIYTRYADDLTFSSQNRIENDFLEQVTDIIQARGFVLNDKKTRFLGRGDRMDVTGVVINDGVNLPVEWRNWARGFLHRVVHNPDDFVSEHSTIAGMMGVLKSIDPEEKKRLTQKARLALEALRTARDEGTEKSTLLKDRD